MVKIALVDYGVGNLHSAGKALEAVGAAVHLASDRQALAAADGLVLPGVGAFDAAVTRLRACEMDQPLLELIAAGMPLLGICVGMQMLFSGSEEGLEPGLGVLPGRVRRFADEPGLTIPQIGWNRLHFDQPDCPLWRGLPPESWVYFVHSYWAEPASDHLQAASAVHGQQRFTAAVGSEQLWAVQFHPEKSAAVGLRILANFVGLIGSAR